VSPVAVVGFASETGPADGRNAAELLGPVVDQALAESGLTRADIDVVCSASSELLDGVVGSVMGAFDVLGCWPPATHSHLEGDGAWALYEAWVRVLAGEGQAALACAYSRPLGDDPRDVLALQLDPYLLGPFAPHPLSVAALQARALLDAGHWDENDLAAVVSARRPGLSTSDVLDQPYLASPLRLPDCSTVCSGAAAVVLAAEETVARVATPPAWIAGIDHRVETGALGGRQLTRSVSTEAAAARLGVPGTSIDVLEVHAPFSHQELIVVEALGAAALGAVNPSGGALPADPIMATGLIRIGEAAEAVRRGDARRAVAHATNGPCLQHNLLCLLEEHP
jgi:acetyl-CoA acetyltransferase